MKIESGDPDGVFIIDGNGNLIVDRPELLNHEATPSFTLSVKVTDDDGLFATANIDISVLDINDEEQLTVNLGATFAEGSTNQIIDNTRLRATDQDHGPAFANLHTLVRANVGNLVHR